MNDYFVPTRCSVNGSKSYSYVEHTLPLAKSRSESNSPKSSIYSKSLKKIKLKAKLHPKDDTKNRNTDNTREKQAQQKEMKKLRFEVFKFAQIGLEAKDKFDADKELAIRLGAARPKREGKNYKELKNELEKRRNIVNKVKANPSLSSDVSTYDPYKKRFNLTKKMRLDRKKGDIGGMLSDYGQVHTKSKKPRKRW